MTRDEPCTGSEGVVGYGPTDTWPLWLVRWKNGVIASPDSIACACNGDVERRDEPIRHAMFVRRLS